MSVSYLVCMAPVRSVTDLLAEQSDETLQRMLERVAAELGRLTIEKQQIEQAIAKRSRRRGSSRGGLTREQAFEQVWLAVCLLEQR